MAGKFSFTQSLRGIDFYGPDQTGNPVLISISTNLVATPDIYYPPANPASISITSDLQSDGTKVAIGSSSPSASATLVAVATEIVLGASSIDSQSSISAIGTRIQNGQSIIDGIAFVLSSGIAVIPMGEVLISSSATVDNLGFIRFSPSIVEDTQSIRPFLVIDNIPLSEHGRTIDESLIHSFIEVKNWDALKSRFYKRTNARRSFKISWTYLPGEREFTADRRFGRNKVKEIAEDPDLHILKIRNIDTNGVTPYTEDEYSVLIKSYNEKLLRRDEINGVYYWDCSMELEEV